MQRKRVDIAVVIQLETVDQGQQLLLKGCITWKWNHHNIKRGKKKRGEKEREREDHTPRNVLGGLKITGAFNKLKQYKKITQTVLIQQ